MFKWKKGRQGTGYQKLCLFRFLFLDCYILRYKRGDFIPWHTDPIDLKDHYRLNITLRKADVGGKLFVLNPIYKKGRVCLFRSDNSKHKVTRVMQGERWVLTFGVAI